MPYTNHGNKYAVRRNYWAPGISRTTAQQPAAAPPAARKRMPLQWEPSELKGPQLVTIGKTDFHLPADAKIKVRPPLVWVLTFNVVHVLSERGDLLLPARDHLKFAEKWDSI